MQTIEIYITLACLIYVWDEKLRLALMFKQDNLGRYYPKTWFRGIATSQKKIFVYFNKFISCGFCISFWSGILLTIVTGSIIFLTLPVSYKLIHKYL